MKRSLSIPFFSILLLLAACSKHLYVQGHHEQQYVVDNNSTGDSAINSYLRPYKHGVDTQMQVVIGHTDIPLTKAQPECTLGNFIADAQLVAAKKLDNKVVASVSNYGGMRIPYIAPGPILKGKVYELMPFDNTITIMDVPGDVLQKLCDKVAAAKGWPVSGLQFAIKDKTAQNVMINGQPLDEHIVYKIAVNDYMARGGDNCDFLSTVNKRFTSIFVRDALIDYIMALESNNKPLHPELEKRISYAE